MTEDWTRQVEAADVSSESTKNLLTPEECHHSDERRSFSCSSAIVEAHTLWTDDWDVLFQTDSSLSPLIPGLLFLASASCDIFSKNPTDFGQECSALTAETIK